MAGFLIPTLDVSKMDMIEKLLEEEEKFCKAADQVHQLNIRIHNIILRHNHAVKMGMKTSAYHLRLQSHVASHMRNIYYAYTREKARAIAEIRLEAFGEVVDILEEV